MKIEREPMDKETFFTEYKGVFACRPVSFL